MPILRDPHPSVKLFDPAALAATAEQTSGPVGVLLAGLAQLLQAAGPVEVTIRIGGTTPPAVAPAVAIPSPPPAEPVNLALVATSPISRQILLLLEATDKPLKGTSIAKRLNRKCTPHFRTCLSRMRKAGLVVYLDGGFWDASRDLPKGLTAANIVPLPQQLKAPNVLPKEGSDDEGDDFHPSIAERMAAVRAEKYAALPPRGNLD
jgi:hypothetical protein